MSRQPANDELDLLVIGDCNPDVLVLGDDVTPAFGQQEKIVASMALMIGGSASIMAVAASRLGLRVALAAAIGADPAGEFMLSQLAAEGVDTGAVVVRPGQATGMTVALSRGTDRAILTALGAMPMLTTADVDPVLVARARHVHVSSYFLLERTLGPGLAALLDRARTAGATTSLDTNWDPAGVWGGDQLDGVLAATDLLLPNETEACFISGEADMAKAITALAARGPRVAVKRGALGARCFDGTGSWLARPPDDRVVDATGAGDCFNAGVIAGLLLGQELPEAVRLGCAVGTASTHGPGGTSAAPSLAAALEEAERVTLTRAED